MRDIVTTLLEVLGVLGLVAGAFVLLQRYDLSIAFSVSGVLLFVASAVLTWLDRPRGDRR